VVTLDVIEERLVQYGAYLTSQRWKYTQLLNDLLSPVKVQIKYLPSPQVLRELLREKMRGKVGDKGNVALDKGNVGAGISEKRLRELLQEKMREKFGDLREKERALGFSLIGPQRDDFKVYAHDPTFPEEWKNLGVYGSRGQQRMAVLRLKLGEGELIQQEIGESPVLLLDDVLSELDEDNQRVLLGSLSKQQVFITSAQEERWLSALDTLQSTGASHIVLPEFA